ncbi:hypothetical protein OROMI_014270 [Orobanche minor]
MASGKTMHCDMISQQPHDHRVVIVYFTDADGLEAGLGHLPLTEKSLHASSFLLVDISWALLLQETVGFPIFGEFGESMDNALCAWCEGINEKILIHSEGDDGKQDTFYHGLTPEELEHVHDYNFYHPGAPEGIHGVCKHFPSLNIVTSEMDVALNKEFCVIPSMGEFSDHHGLCHLEKRIVTPTATGPVHVPVCLGGASTSDWSTGPNSGQAA